MATDSLSVAASLVKAVYDAAQQAKHNKDQCRTLASRVQGLGDALSSLHVKYVDQPSIARVLTNLQSALRDCLSHIESHNKKGWIKRLVNNGNDSQRFKELHATLDSLGGDFNVATGIVTMQAASEVALNQAAEKDAKFLEENAKTLAESGLEDVDVGDDKFRKDCVMSIAKTISRNARHHPKEADNPETKSESSSSVHAHEIPFSHLKLSKFLGRGGFSEVWEARQDPFATKAEAKAFEWYKKAAELGQVDAMCNLGVCYDYGKGVDKDEAKAFEWYKKAAEFGQVDAMRNLGNCYANGDSVAKDEAKAFEWYKKAAEFGQVDAMRNLGNCYSNGKGVAHDESKAFEWYKKAAGLGQADAMFNLAICYAQGSGIKKDVVKAVEWYKKAADLGEVAAMANLGNCYEHGRGVVKDEAMAFTWYKKAAYLGHSTAMYNIGWCYEIERGVQRNEETARSWYQRAEADRKEPTVEDIAQFERDESDAELGHASSMCTLGNRYLYGKGVQRDLEKGFAWHLKGAQLGSSIAMINVAVCYERGWGTVKDEAKAAVWFARAADPTCTEDNPPSPAPV